MLLLLATPLTPGTTTHAFQGHTLPDTFFLMDLVGNAVRDKPPPTRVTSSGRPLALGRG